MANAAWAANFLADAENGHASRTMQLVEAVRKEHWKAAGASFLCQLGLPSLKASLDNESSAAGRNRFLRRWLATHSKQIVDSWRELGFPGAPSDSEPASVSQNDDIHSGSRSRAGPGLSGRTGSQASHTGVAVFDFDQTLTTRHVGVFEDMASIEGRAFGGPERVAVLRDMLAGLRDRGAAVALVTRNSRHVVSKALGQVGLLRFVNPGSIFGFEDYGDDVPKSTVVAERVLAPFRLKVSQALFVDDDPSNITDLEERCPGIAVLKCPRTGLSEEEIRQVATWAADLRGSA